MSFPARRSGYRYVRKSDASTAYSEVAEAKVVRMVFEMYTLHRLSINAIARLLNEQQIPTRTGKGGWERSPKLLSPRGRRTLVSSFVAVRRTMSYS